MTDFKLAAMEILKVLMIYSSDKPDVVKVNVNQLDPVLKMMVEQRPLTEVTAFCQQIAVVIHKYNIKPMMPVKVKEKNAEVSIFDQV